MYLFFFLQTLSLSDELYEYTEATCSKTDDGLYVIKDGLKIDKDTIAYAQYNNSIKAVGWYKMHITGVEGKDDKDMMHCAGMLEGYLAHAGIWNHFSLIKDIQGYTRGNMYPEHIHEFLENNYKYTKLSVEAYQDSLYWKQVGLVLEQFHGLVEGYAIAVEKLNLDQKMSLFDHWFFQSAGDMFDLSAMFKNDKLKEFNEHCTGMVKLTENYDDIFFAHDAWSDFRELHGELKELHLPLSNASNFKAKHVIMSTRVGKISSYDDYYLNDAGLFVIETTLNNYNPELYKLVVPQNLFTWMRAYRATWVSDSGKEWATEFIKHNSGTYNNQYVIVDSKKLQFGVKPTEDLLWIIEQFPGTYRMTDVTFQLVRDLYFPSINCPWHEELYNLAGYPELVKSMGKYGAYRSYKEGPRYLIMKREAPRIKTFEQFKQFMRYNNYLRDNYSQGDPAQQIASRYDLRPPTTPYGVKNHFGDLDSKCLRLTEAVTKMRIHALASPPNNEFNHIPVWSFSKWNEENQPINYDGLPDVWNFTWETFESNDYDLCSPHDDRKEDNKLDCFARSKLCGWCHDSKKCMAGGKDQPMYGTCDGGWTIKTEVQSWAKPVVITICVISVAVATVIFVAHIINARKEQL